MATPATPPATKTARLYLSYANLAVKNPVTVRLHGIDKNGGVWTTDGQGIKIDALTGPDGSSTPVSLSEIAISSSEILVNPGDTTSFRLSITAQVSSTGVLEGEVNIGTGSVTIGQVGSPDTDAISESKEFTISLDLA